MTSIDTHGSDPVSSDTNTKRLAQSEGLGNITMCGCGTLSVNVQAMSLRLDVKAFAQLLMMCAEAMDVLEAIAHRKANEPVALNPLSASPHIH